MFQRKLGHPCNRGSTTCFMLLVATCAILPVPATLLNEKEWSSGDEEEQRTSWISLSSTTHSNDHLHQIDRHHSLRRTVWPERPENWEPLCHESVVLSRESWAEPMAHYEVRLVKMLRVMPRECLQVMNELDEFGWNLLHWASRSNRLESSALLQAVCTKDKVQELCCTLQPVHTITKRWSSSWVHYPNHSLQLVNMRDSDQHTGIAQASLKRAKLFFLCIRNHVQAMSLRGNWGSSYTFIMPQGSTSLKQFGFFSSCCQNPSMWRQWFCKIDMDVQWTRVQLGSVPHPFTRTMLKTCINCLFVVWQTSLFGLQLTPSLSPTLLY